MTTKNVLLKLARNTKSNKVLADYNSLATKINRSPKTIRIALRDLDNKDMVKRLYKHNNNEVRFVGYKVVDASKEQVQNVADCIQDYNALHVGYAFGHYYEADLTKDTIKKLTGYSDQVVSNALLQLYLEGILKVYPHDVARPATFYHITGTNIKAPDYQSIGYLRHCKLATMGKKELIQKVLN